MAPSVAASIAEAVAEQRLRLLAGLIRVTGDWELAQDCLQDAAERALLRWPTDGIPTNPAAWLATTAARRAVDVQRRRRLDSRKLTELASRDSGDPLPDNVFHDDQLELVYTCAHPALPLASRVALTLKAVGGLTTRQIAAAFLVSESTVSQRLLRARNKIAHAGIRLSTPGPDRLAERTAGVHAVLYLIFTQGYATIETQDGVHLGDEAVRLAGQLARLRPDDAETMGLRALLLLQHARRRARADGAGRLIPMEEQDRGRWDGAMIATGLAALDAARSGPEPAGPYRLQAEIAALHATAPSAGATDWAGVVTWHEELLRQHPSPVVALNLAVARGFRDGPEAGLAALDALEDEPRLAGYFLLPAARADLLRRSGRAAESASWYRQALVLVESPGERAFLQRRLHEALDPS